MLDVFQACPAGRQPCVRPRTHWRDYASWLAREHLGMPKERLENDAGERNIRNTLLGLLPPMDKRMEMDGWTTVGLALLINK